MIIKTLIENNSTDKRLACEHGLSLYIETGNIKILFDTGASNAFSDNAEKMNVDLAQVDVAFISHGHYDHGGGLKTFLKLNSKAKIYLSEKAFNNYYASTGENKVEYIGLPKDIDLDNRFELIGEKLRIDDNLFAFTNVEGKCLTPSGNKKLFYQKEEEILRDDFKHEMNLIVTENGKNILLAGCAHKGIVNIMEHIKKSKEKIPDYVIGGFHLYSRSGNDNEEIKKVKQIGLYLNETKSKFYTCHCTGLENFEVLKRIMGNKIEYIMTGSEIII